MCSIYVLCVPCMYVVIYMKIMNNHHIYVGSLHANSTRNSQRKPKSIFFCSYYFALLLVSQGKAAERKSRAYGKHVTNKLNPHIASSRA